MFWKIRDEHYPDVFINIDAIEAITMVLNEPKNITVHVGSGKGFRCYRSCLEDLGKILNLKLR